MKKLTNNVKIGGKHYSIEVSDNISLGRVNCSAEIDYEQLTITVAEQAKEKMEADLMHEIMHGIYFHLGYREHNEKEIDELASAFYMVIKDNPDLFVNMAEGKEK